MGADGQPTDLVSPDSSAAATEPVAGPTEGGLLGGMSRLLGRSPVRKSKQRARVLCMAFQGENMFTGGSVSGEICASECKTGRLLDVFSGHTESVTCLCFAFQRLWSCSTDKTIRVWEVKDGGGVCVLTIADPRQVVNCLARSGNIMFSSSDDSLIRGYNAASVAATDPSHTRAMSRASRVAVTLRGHTGSVNALVHKRSRLWSSSNDGTVRCWDPARATCLRCIATGLQGVWGLVVFRRQQRDCVVCSSIGGTVHVLDSEGKSVRQLRGHQQVVRSLFHWDASDTLFSCSKDETIRVWNLQRLEPVETLFGHEKSVNCLALRGSELYSGATDKHVFTWDVRDIVGNVQVSTTDQAQEENERCAAQAGCCVIA